jgi:L-lactate utilization protein LutC
LCEAFAAEVVAVGGEAFVVDDLEQAREVVRRLCREAQAKTALCWQHELLDRIHLSDILAEESIEPIDRDSLPSGASMVQRQQILAADIGITSCDWAIAETGSLLMCARPGQERVASLLPPVHVAVVERSQILPDLYDAIAKLQALGVAVLPGSAVFITGPSKTGDMELELTTGVHGPGRWCVVVVRS